MPTTFIGLASIGALGLSAVMYSTFSTLLLVSIFTFLSVGISSIYFASLYFVISTVLFVLFLVIGNLEMFLVSIFTLQVLPISSSFISISNFKMSFVFLFYVSVLVKPFLIFSLIIADIALSGFIVIFSTLILLQFFSHVDVKIVILLSSTAISATHFVPTIEISDIVILNFLFYILVLTFTAGNVLISVPVFLIFVVISIGLPVNFLLILKIIVVATSDLLDFSNLASAYVISLVAIFSF